MVLLGRLHDKRADLAPMGTAWRLPGHLLLAFVLPFFTFHESVERFLRSYTPTDATRVFLSAAAVAALALLFIRVRGARSMGQSPAVRAPLVESGMATASALVLACVLWKPRGMSAWIWVAFFDVFYLAYCGVLIYLADRTRVWWTGYLGVVMFTGFVVCRYFEYAIRLLPKSFVFIAAGALLLAGGVFLERRRRGGRKEAAP
jgi:uncharacterized membrane protein